MAFSGGVLLLPLAHDGDAGAGAQVDELIVLVRSVPSLTWNEIENENGN